MAESLQRNDDILEHETMDVGSRLRYHRTVQDLTLRELARKAGCSNSLISQIEAEKVSPSLKTMERICRALELTVSDFLRIEPVDDPPVFIPRCGDRTETVMRWEKARLFHLLDSEATGSFTALLLRLETGGFTSIRRSIRSLKDLNLVLTGKVMCRIGTSEFALETGEGLFFDAAQPHQWFNRGNEPAEIMITSPVSFKLFEKLEKEVRWHELFRHQKKKTKRVQRSARKAA
ncbi:MAG: helix-turn-helix domain-containing protein [Verrucomicrobia bacterium]|nr:helix-turn-helix domain-containing protein [Verrucomicrobiota bacterium]